MTYYFQPTAMIPVKLFIGYIQMSSTDSYSCIKIGLVRYNWTEAEFKEFERFTFKPRLKFWWFHLNLYELFQDLGRRSVEPGFWGIWDAA